MQNKDIVNYLITLFKIDSPYIINDLIEDIETLNNKENLIPFIKHKMNYQNFKFLNSFEKLTALISEFKKENKPKLDELSNQRVYTYSQSLVKKLTDISFEIDYQSKIKSIDLKGINIAKTYENNLSDKDIEICKLIGYRLIYSLAISNIPKLEELIESNVNKKALEKQYPQLVNKNSFEGIETIKKLQKVSNSNNN
ncbi:hypothetical protein ACOTVP_08665 [Aliarcobacter butzleri]